MLESILSLNLLIIFLAHFQKTPEPTISNERPTTPDKPPSLEENITRVSTFYLSEIACLCLKICAPEFDLLGNILESAFHHKFYSFIMLRSCFFV